LGGGSITAKNLAEVVPALAILSAGGANGRIFQTTGATNYEAGWGPRGSWGSLQPVAQLMCSLDFAWYIGCFPIRMVIMLGIPMGWMSIKPCSETM